MNIVLERGRESLNSLLIHFKAKWNVAAGILLKLVCAVSQINDDKVHKPSFFSHISSTWPFGYDTTTSQLDDKEMLSPYKLGVQFFLLTNNLKKYNYDSALEFKQKKVLT